MYTLSTSKIKRDVTYTYKSVGAFCSKGNNSEQQSNNLGDFVFTTKTNMSPQGALLLCDVLREVTSASSEKKTVISFKPT
jgi:hypothetical protein